MDSMHSSLFSKTRQAILALLYLQGEESFYLREIVKLTHSSLGAVQRELKLLTEAGFLLRRADGKQVYYRSNPDCLIYSEVLSIIQKTCGVANQLHQALDSLAKGIRVAFLFGSFVEGKALRSSDIDLLIVGDVTLAQVLKAIAQVQERLHQEINPILYSEQEFIAKIASGQHFLTTLLDQPKVFLFGDASELDRMVTERVGR